VQRRHPPHVIGPGGQTRKRPRRAAPKARHGWARCKGEWPLRSGARPPRCRLVVRGIRVRDRRLRCPQGPPRANGKWEEGAGEGVVASHEAERPCDSRAPRRSPVFCMPMRFSACHSGSAWSMRRANCAPDRFGTLYSRGSVTHVHVMNHMYMYIDMLCTCACSVGGPECVKYCTAPGRSL